MSNLFGKLIVKIGLVLGLMTACIAVAIAISDEIFSKASDSMRDLGEVRVPALLGKVNTLATTSRLQQGFSDLLLATNPETVGPARDAALALLTGLKSDTAASGVPESKVSAIQGLIDQLADARLADFAAGAEVTAAMAALKAHVDSIAAHLTEAEDTAFFDLAVNGEATVDGVGKTLDTLVEKDFTALRLALQVRAATTDMAGLTLARGQSSDAALRPILNDLIISAQSELEKILPELPARPELAGLEAPVTNFLQAVGQEAGTRLGGVDVQAIIAARGEVDKMVVSAIDEIEFNLVVAAADAKDSNAAAIRALIDVQVAGIRDGAHLSALVRQSVILALETFVAESPDQIAVLSDQLRPILAELSTVIEATSDAEIKSGLTELVAVVQPDTGVPALRLASLAARAEAARLAAEAATLTADIAGSASSGLDGVLTEVTNSTTALLQSLTAAQDQMWQIGAGAGALVLLSVVLTWLTVVRPLGRVTRLTERLAAGDLSPILGMDRWRGEVGRMVSALKVFRDGMDERATLEAERKQAEADALRRAEEQEQVVRVLAAAFRRLSEGDLDVAIGDDFPEDYQALRGNFNAAIQRLSGLLRAVADLGDRIRASSREISGTSQDLSTRTEHAASTLQTTVTELAGLAHSVRESADRVVDAAKLGTSARNNAEDSVSVIRTSLELMNSIADAFKRISAVIGLIDEIAFQTNLLALNAAVEAARAGDAGRGFAVVASEVRSLAQRSSDAARDIKKVISESDALVATGVKATGQAGQSLSGIVEAVIAMADRIEMIASSSAAQSATIADVSRVATGLDENMHYNVARFEETTAASRSLSEEAQVLSSRLQEFRLPPNQGQSRARPAHSAPQPSAKPQAA